MKDARMIMVCSVCKCGAALLAVVVAIMVVMALTHHLYRYAVPWAIYAALFVFMAWLFHDAEQTWRDLLSHSEGQ